MPEVPQPQLVDPGQAQLSLFGADEPRRLLLAATAPTGPRAPDTTELRADTDVSVGVRDPDSSAGHSETPQEVATPDADQSGQSATTCTLSIPLKPVEVDAGLVPRPLRFTLDALYSLVDEIERLRTKGTPRRGDGCVQTGVADGSRHGGEPESGEDPG
jgi:hypothetical protein